jgi:translation initiation factor IF-1
VAQKQQSKKKSPPRREPREERVVEENSDVIRAEGVVLDARPNTTFKVKLDAGPEVLAHVGGKLRRNYIRILPGDRVVLEISTYDKEKGRIVYRK